MILRLWYNSRMNLETKGDPQSEITFVGSPQFQKILFSKIFATPLDDKVVLHGSRTILFENLSTITMTASYPLDFGRGPIISIEIVCQGEGGIS